MREVVLRNGQTRPAVAATRYDRKADQCSAGGLQLLDGKTFQALTDGWRLPDACTGAKKQQVPSTTGYPERFAQLRKSGSAHVLVRIQADGSIESARAVCASDSAFADAAEQAALTIRFAPATCDGKPIRSSFLLPFDYAFR